MSTTIDNRVVDMQFNNRQFESGAKTTLSTLERLKSALNFDGVSKSLSNGFSNIERSMSLNGIASGIDNISSRFSAMGIVGATVISNLTTQAMGFAQKLAGLAINPIVEGGKRRALNIEQAKFQLGGLGVEWDKIEEDISYGVQDTAYGLDAAATVASQLVASNVALGDSMKTALRGVSGVAAMTGASYEEIGHIFTTVAGQGRLMGMQLTQLSMRGINAAATLGDALGKTEGEIREMVSKGQIDFATFAKAMDDAYGAHAKDANKTFTGALSNTRAALSRIGAKFATPAFENIKNVLNDLIPVINNVNKALDPFVELASNGMTKAAAKISSSLKNIAKIKALDYIVKDLTNALTNVISGIHKVSESGKKALDKVFTDSIVDRVKKLSESISDFSEKFKMSGKTAEKFQSVFEGIFGLFYLGKTALFEIFRNLTPFASLISDTFGSAFDNVLNRLTSFGDHISFIVEKTKKGEYLHDNVKRLFDLLKRNLSPLKNNLTEFWNSLKTLILPSSDVFTKFSVVLRDIFAKDYTNISGWQKLSVFSKILSNVGKTIINLGTAAVKFAQPIEDAIIEMFPSVNNLGILGITKAISDFTAKLIINDITFEKLKRTFKGVLAVADIFAQILSAFIRALFPSVSSAADGMFLLGDGVLSVTSGLGDWLVALSESLKENDTFYNGISKFVEFIKAGFQIAKDAVISFADAYEERTGKKIHAPTADEIIEFFDKAKTKLAWVPALFEKIKNSVKGFFDWFNEDKDGKKSKSVQTVIDLLTSFSNTTSKVAPGLSEFFSNLGETFDKINYDRLGKLLNIGMFIILINVLTKLRGVISGLFNWDLFGNINGVLSGLRSGLAAFTGTIKANTLVTYAKAIGILAASVIALSVVDGDSLSRGVIAIGSLMLMLHLFMARTTKFLSGWDVKGIWLFAAAMAVSIALLGNVAKQLGELDPAKLAIGLGAVLSLLAAITLSSKFLPADSGVKLTQMAGSMIIFAIAMTIMSKALSELASVKGSGDALLFMVIALMSFGTAALLFSRITPDIVMFSAGILTMSASMLVLSFAVERLASALNAIEDPDKTFKSLGLIVGAMFAFGIAASIFTSVVPQMMVFAAGMVTMAVSAALLSLSVNMLSMALERLGQIKNAGKSVLLLGGALLVFGVLSAIFVSVVPQMMMFAAAALTMSGAMIAFSIAMNLLSDAIRTAGSIENAGKGLLTIAGALVIFGAVSAMFVALTPGLTSFALMLIPLGIGVGFLAVALNLLIPVFTIFSQMDFAKIGKGLLAVFGAIGILVLFGSIAAILGALSPSIISFSFALITLSLAIAAMSVSLMMLAPFLTYIGNIDILKIVGGIIALSAGILAFGIVATILRPAIKAISLFALSLGVLGLAVVAVGAVLGGLVYVTGDAIQKFMQTLIDALPMLADLSIKLLIGLINSLATGIANNSDQILGALRNVFGALLVFAMSIIEQFIRDYIPGVGNSIADKVGEWKGIVADYWITGNDDVGAEGAELFASGINSSTGESSKAGSGLGSAATSALGKFFPSFTENGNLFGEGFANGLADSNDLSSISGFDLGDSALDGLGMSETDFGDYGNLFGEGFATKLDGTSGMASNSASNVADNSISAINSKYSDFRDSGHNAGTGFANGLFIDSRSEVYDSGSKLARVALNSIRAELDEHSPSKETQYMGMMGGKGLANGFIGTVSIVREAATLLGEKALDSLKNPMLHVRNILASDIDVNPTIRPVLDLSDVQAGMSTMDFLIANRQMNIGLMGGGMSYKNAINATVSKEKFEQQADKSNVIVSLIEKLENDVVALGDKMSRMQVRMDGAALVGELIDPIDAELGHKASLRRRGV